jgi:hypothetical protein
MVAVGGIGVAAQECGPEVVEASEKVASSSMSREKVQEVLCNWSR